MIDLDGTLDQGARGANAILAVSLALAKRSAASAGLHIVWHLGDYAQRPAATTR